ncbi:MAG TPA: DNA replication/repair protein RecF [Steroidobacteraceae bacterium]
MLTEVEITNFRCIESARLELGSAGTGILGSNASGKTSLLEAIFFLGHGRSFRTNVRDKLVRAGSRFFRVVGKVESARGPLTAGTEYIDGESRTRLAGEGVSSVSQIAEVVPIQLIDPGVHRLVEEGSARRRRLLDWGVFHVKHDFIHGWRRYQRALSQRNAALRAGQGPEVLSAWERELDQYGTAIDQARASYSSDLAPHFESIAGPLLDESVTLTYRRGWPTDQTLLEALGNARLQDQRLRTTTVGPHRADLAFKMAGVSAKDRVSRGQQKMLAAAFILAQTRLRAETATVPTCLLLDDPAAELDVDNLGKLLKVIDTIPSQLIVTSVSESGLSGMNIARRFHVEQGKFAPML